MIYNIFLAKESRAGERRVALIPQDIATLIEKGHSVCVESNAGLAAGYEDEIFAAVVDHNGFSHAAKHMGISPALVSRRIRELEKQLGVTL